MQQMAAVTQSKLKRVVLIVKASGVDSESECYFVMVMYGERDKEDPWQGSTPECSTLELLLQDTRPDVVTCTCGVH